MLLRHTILYLPAQLLGPITQFLSVIVWTHWLSPAEFGVLMLVTVTHELAFAVTLSGFSIYAVRHIPDAGDVAKRREFYHTEASMLAISSLLSVVVAFGLLYVVLDTPPTLLMVFATLVFFVTRSINLHFAERVRADAEIGNYTLLQTVGPVLGFVLGLLFMANFEASPQAVIVGYALAQVAALLLVLPRTGFCFQVMKPNREMVRDSIAYGLPLVLAGGLSWFSNHGIRFIVKYGMDLASVGLLSVPWGLGRRSVGFAANLVNGAAFPLAVKRLKEGSREEAMEQLSMNGAMLFGVLAPTIVGVWAINELLVKSLIDERFQVVTMELLPLAVIAGGIGFFRAFYPDQVFLLDSNTKIFLKIDTIESISVLLFCSIGLWFIGLYGAVLGAALGMFVGAVTSFGYAIAAGGIIVLWVHFGRIILACLAMVLVIKLIPFPVNIVGLVTSIFMGASVYALVLAPFYYREVKEVLGSLRQ